MFRGKRPTVRPRDVHDLDPADRQLLEGMTDLLRENREADGLPEHFAARSAYTTTTNSEPS